MKKKRHGKKVVSHRRTKKKLKNYLPHLILTLSGFALLLFFLFSLSLRGFADNFPLSEEISLFLITALTVTFVIERGIRLKRERIYENFYSTYLATTILILTIIYWVTYLNNIDIAPFRIFITLALIIIFLYSLITVKHGERLWFIVVSYGFAALITIILFAYIYWTISIFGTGHLQFNNCSVIDPSIESENWFYFSSVTFYSLGYGDICPIGSFTRLISQIEVAAGALINTILIGFIFWKIRETSVEEQVEKEVEKRTK